MLGVVFKHFMQIDSVLCRCCYYPYLTGEATEGPERFSLLLLGPSNLMSSLSEESDSDISEMIVTF